LQIVFDNHILDYHYLVHHVPKPGQSDGIKPGEDIAATESQRKSCVQEKQLVLKIVGILY